MHSSTPRNPVLLKALLFLSYALATLQFLRAYVIVDQPYLDALKYEQGTERMPYQARILMSWLMRSAESNSLLLKIAGKLRGPLHSADVLAMLFVNLFSMILLAIVVRAFYRHLSTSGRLSWMPYFIVLWMAAETYIVRFQEAIYFPYDLLAASLFFLCIYLSYRERYLVLIPVFLIACINRETIIMIVPLILLNAFTAGVPVKKRWKDLALAALLTVCAVYIHLQLTHRYAGNETELGVRLKENLHFLMNLQTWPQIASACGFLLPVPFLFWRFLREPRLRLYTLLIPSWCLIMLFVGLLPESRIFGELIGLLAVLCTLIFERAYPHANNAATAA